MTYRTIQSLRENARQTLSGVLSDPEESLAGPTMDLRQNCFSTDFRKVRKECRCAVPFVFMSKAGNSLSIGQADVALSSLQSLNARLFIHA
jgi:hypothetical protein